MVPLTTAGSTTAMEAGANGRGSLGIRPSLVEWKNMRFLIMDAPKTNNLHLYVRECKTRNVTHLCRVCEETYPAGEVESAGIEMHEMEYDDGDAPPPEVIAKWLDVVHLAFNGSGKADSDNPCIAVHCVAGLGRAPVLVAIALIEQGMDPIQAVNYIRAARRGAINLRQLSYLEQYQRSRQSGCSSCSCM